MATDTSVAAYRSIKNLTESQNRIRYVMRLLNQGSDEAIASCYRMLQPVYDWPAMSPSGMRTRRKELVAQGWLQDSGLRSLTESNRQTIIWQITEKEETE